MQAKSVPLRPKPTEARQCPTCRRLMKWVWHNRRLSPPKGYWGSHCFTCERNARKVKNPRYRKEQRDRKRQKNPNYSLEENIRQRAKRFNLTLAEYDAKLASQHYLCGTCGMPEQVIDPRTLKVKRLALDHNHNTGQVRAFLCSNCNSAIEHAEENPLLLLTMADYLEQWKKIPYEPKHLGIESEERL